ncbi:MAG: multicopper oxidase family protein, partial [Sphingomicrobium sp.]
IDVLLKDKSGRPFPERIMLFQHIQYGCLNDKGLNEGKRDAENVPMRPFTCAPGKVGGYDSFDNDWGWQQIGRYAGINGKVQPRLADARAGAFERWRMINAGTGEGMRMRLRRLDPAAPPLASVRAEDQIAWRERYCTGNPLPMWEIALDGLTRSDARKTDEAVLFAGERKDLLVRLPEPGHYCMINDTSRIDVDKDDPNRPRMVALVAASGGAGAGNGNELLTATLVRSAERALAGNDRASVRERVIGELRDGLKLASFTWHKPVAKEEVSAYREVVLNVLDGPEATAFRVNGLTYDHNRLDALLPLGKAEEWRAASLNENHPLHIHVNPFEIVSIKDHQGRDMADPKSEAFDADYAGLIGQWKDTVLVKNNVRVAFRTRYERFTGDFVIHCHIMFHGDHGMMQNLRIAAEGEAAAPHAGH